MLLLPREHPSIYKKLMRGNFLVKASTDFFNAVTPDTKLEQSIQRSKEGAGGIIGQTKQNAFVTEWELAYHEVLDISKSYSNIKRSILAETDAATLSKEFRSKNMKEYYEALKQVLDFLIERGNPYKVVGPFKLHHFISKQVVHSDKSDCILSFFEDVGKNYLKFREERFLRKEKKLADTLKRITVP